MVLGLATISGLRFNIVRSKHLHRAVHAPQTVQANTDRVLNGPVQANFRASLHLTTLKLYSP